MATQSNHLLQEAKKFIAENNLAPDSSHFGQHFLIDAQSIGVFVQAMSLKNSEHVLEIGPGLGFITSELLKNSQAVHSIDIDTRLEPVLSEIQKTHDNFSYSFENALTRENYAYDVVCGALSYSIFEPLMRILIFKRDFSRAVFVVSEKFEREFEKKENMFALSVRAFFEVEFIKVLPKEFFYPEPRYPGVIIKLTPHDKTDVYSTLLRQLFLQHDKKLKNALREAFIMGAEAVGKTLTKKQSKALFVSQFTPEVLEQLVFQVPKSEVSKLNACIERFVQEF